MEYFQRNKEQSEKLKNEIRNIECAVKNIYKDQEERCQNSEVIRLHETTLSGEELIAFVNCYLKGNITMSEINKKYEYTAKQYFGTGYCVSNNSGSSANLLAISGLIQTNKLKAGDKVLVPALSWSTTVFPLLQYGLIPVFIDQDSESYNMDILKIKECIKEVGDIKAIMIIHTYGNPADIDSIMNIADEEKVVIIEDTCESMGASYKGKKVGSFGDVGTFSTYYSHHLCTLEGGLTVTNDEELDSVMQSIRSHGWIRHRSDKNEIARNNRKDDPNFVFNYAGYNLRMSEPQAAIGIEQFKKLDKFIMQRQSNAQKFISVVRKTLTEDIKTPRVSKGSESSWFGMPVIINKCNRHRLKRVKESLRDQGIESRPFLAGNFSTQPVMKKYNHIKYGSMTNTEMLENCALALPCHQSLNTNDMEKIAESLKNALETNV